MAQHLVSFATAGIPVVSKDDFYRKHLRAGDMVACCGQSAIAKEIEHCTGSLLSHILMVHLPFADGPWNTLEATFTKGVHVGDLSDYTDCQDGPIILLRRPALTERQTVQMLEAGLALLDSGYDWQQEVTTVAHRLLHCLPVMQPKNELYCSGLMYAIAKDVAPFAYQIDRAHPNYPSPEDIYTDPSVEAVCCLLP